MQRASLAQGYFHQITFGGLGCLADGLGHLARRAMAEADPSLLIADHDERGKTETPSALDHLGDAIDVNELVDEFAVALALFTVSCLLASCHGRSFPGETRISGRLRARRRRAP